MGIKNKAVVDKVSKLMEWSAFYKEERSSQNNYISLMSSDYT